jgi:ubiquinone/menaquinone biosynthesis C-methylase UbiE
MDYQKINKQFWNDAVPKHVESDFYNMPDFLAGKTSLCNIELQLLGDVTDKTMLHLQCHFGQDTISLQRMGAQCTGVDFSEVAIKQAKLLNQQLKEQATFICSDIYNLPQIHEHQYDIVYTSYGTIGWLPDIDKWAAVVSNFLKPGGKFVFVEFHPVVWMFDNKFINIEYGYQQTDAIIEESIGTYADKNTDTITTNIGWNHGLANVLQALINNNIDITQIQEYDYSPYNCFHNMKQIGTQKYVIPHLENKIPMVYSVIGSKNIGI